MANYKTHTGFNLFLMLPTLVGLSYYFIQPSEKLLTIFIAAFIYATLFMNPDLDLIHQVKFFSLRGILTLPFRGYSKVFRHRGISHSFLLGSLTRIIWLSVVLFLLSFSFSFSGNIFSFCKQFKTYLLYALAGVCLADWSHLLLDFKKTRR